ncbi:hypothetical protein NLD30_11345 [SCandidatus Aminicenantes bacterium Aminicenantia_JdfR_composite]|nr:hypothetical protein [SCandidatus Aminicenantes bacterium Aminicenantia_JdfR_composite]
MVLLVDGTDDGNNLLGGDYSQNENCNFGNVDAIGTAITGGDSMVNNITGTPVDASGNPLTSPYDPTCDGSFYHILYATGGNSATDRTGAGIGIFALGVQASGTSFSLDVTASLSSNTTNVTIDQLKWKDDSTSTSRGYTDYTDFSTGLTNIDTFTGIFYRAFLYHDYGLLVQFEDEPGTNTWTVTYTLTAQ